MRASIAPERPCPACDAQHARRAFEVAGFDHVRCRGCGTVYVSPRPDPAVIHQTNTRTDYHQDISGSEPRMRSEARARARAMQAHGCTRVLEIGCGAGFLVEALLAEGIEAEGVDPGPQARRAAERGLPVHPRWLHEHEPSAPYDGIAMFELLEHVPDPVQVLRWAHRNTEPGALLALSTPSASGLPARLLGRRFPMLCPPDHLEIFSRAGLATVLRRGGFEPIQWHSFSNLDRATLRRGLQRFLLGASGPGRRAADVLATMARVPVGLMDRMGLGTSFEVLARRV